VPLTVIAMVMIHFSLPSRQKGDGVTERVDVIGGVLLAITLGLAVVGLYNPAPDGKHVLPTWGAPVLIGAGIAAVIFAVWERFARTRLIDPAGVRFGPFLAALGASVTAGAALMVTLVNVELFGQGVLEIRGSDIVFSVAKLFFAYGLGNAMSFPMSVGASTVLLPARPTPEAIFDIMRRHRPTIFYGVPSLYAALLAHQDLCIGAGSDRLRVCVSAGEALPAHIGERWRQHFGVGLTDGIGSTEMLHIFLSNRPGAVRYGTAGQPVPGYKVKLVNEDQEQVRAGEIGELHVSGPTSAVSYWNNLAKTRDTFLGEWTRTGDKLRQTAEGDFVYCGRADDMIKVGGIWVSPVEVEATLLEHDSVLEAAVVGVGEGLLKPKAFIVLRPGVVGTPELAQQLKGFVKTKLAPYKYPRWIEFVDELPKTATGKVQRYRLRQASSTSGISLQTNQSSQPR